MQTRGLGSVSDIKNARNMKAKVAALITNTISKTAYLHEKNGTLMQKKFT